MTIIPPNRRVMPTANGQLVSIDHRCAAVVEDDSFAFASKLQDLLTQNTQDGYTLHTMLPREKDQGLVLVFQRVSLVESANDGNDVGASVSTTQGTRH